MLVLKNCDLYGRITDITINDGKILSTEKCTDDGVDLNGLKVYPGLIDVHSHGTMGMDTCTDDIFEMAKVMRKNGTTTWYPTTMTISEDSLIEITQADIESSKGANIPGFHLEGPFINVKYKGAQNPDYVKTPDLSLLEKCKNVKMITIAPEVEGGIDFIKNCEAVVAIGHTDATYDVAMEAFRAGAKCLTHTFNAMPSIHHRAPGPIPAGMESGAYAQIICDGEHVHPAVVKMLIKLYGTDRVILISDSMHAQGMPDGKYVFGGLDIVVKDSIARTEGGNLAGSTKCLADCVRKAIKIGISEYDAVKMASETPARLMGLNKGKVEAGYDADLIIVDGEFNIISTVVRGELDDFQ